MYKNILDCDQSNVYSSRIIFSSNRVKWPVVILDLAQTEVVSFDPPTPKTLL